MRIDLTSIMFNMNVAHGGTPSWGTSLGQKAGHKYIYEGCEEILIGMLYNKVPNEDVYCPLGKGGNRQSDYEYVLSSVFNKIYVNGIYVDGERFVLAIVKQLTAEATQHIGRKILKYSSKMTYKNESINNSCFKAIAVKLGLNDNSAWFITDIVVKNQDELHFVAKIGNESNSLNFDDSTQRKLFCESLTSNIKTKSKGGFNKYYYGAPGCGKSYYVQSLLNEYRVSQGNRFRVTFHPEYSHSDFVGQILPTIVYNYNDEGLLVKNVEYIFNPGPFTKALLRAYQTGDMVYLVIEELNRGNASAIFGDLFQLLDRVEDSNDARFSESQYPVTNVNVHKYIKDELAKDGIEYRENDIVIPSNLTILATMNSSDQNVFTLDTAFKRRWLSEGISNDIESDTNHSYKDWFVPGTNITWSKFLTKLNNKILDYKIENSTSEDKRLGKYFVNKSCLTETATVIGDCKAQANNFSYKVLEYIWNDVCKYGQSDWFDTQRFRTLEELLNGYMSEQLNIFENINFNE